MSLCASLFVGCELVGYVGVCRVQASAVLAHARGRQPSLRLLVLLWKISVVTRSETCHLVAQVVVEAAA